MMMKEIPDSDEDKFSNRYKTVISEQSAGDIENVLAIEKGGITREIKLRYSQMILKAYGKTLKSFAYIAECGYLDTLLEQILMSDPSFLDDKDHNEIARLLLKDTPFSLSGRFDRLDIADQDIIDTLFKSGLTKLITKKEGVKVERDEDNIGKCCIEETENLFQEAGQRYIVVMKDGQLDIYSDYLDQHTDLLPGDDFTIKAYATGGWISFDKTNNNIKLFGKSKDLRKEHPAYKSLIILSFKRYYPGYSITFVEPNDLP